jgi:excinuclease ABC subunit C
VKFRDYDERVEQALDFLSGGSSESLRKLTAQMNEAAENLEFERAASLRDSINAIKRLGDKQKVIQSKVKDQDVIAYFSDGIKACFEVFRFEGGRLCDRQDFPVEVMGDDKSQREEFILSFYNNKTEIPQHITLDGEAENSDLLERWLTEKSGRRVYISVPVIGEQKKLVDMCKQNAAERVAQLSGATGRELSVLQELATLLGLETIPYYIESYDISNISGSDNVAGMVVFENGKPLKKAYRKFRIKSFEGQDDYGSMRQMLQRRLKHFTAGDPGFEIAPDLMLIDGGIAHACVARQLLLENNLKWPVFGMVKDDRHRTRALVTPDGEQIAIDSNQSVFSFIGTIQEETHRFAITYHKTLRSKRLRYSQLDQIPGIGPKRKQELLQAFKSIAAIRAASIEELERVLNKPAAASVYDYFNSKKE